jgi:predicted nucleic acid-binding protein
LADPIVVIIVDTTVWIDYLGGISTLEVEWLHREMERRRLGITDIILGEVLQGIRDDSRFEEVRSELSSFEVLVTGGVDLAVASARNYRALRERGRTVRGTIDALIATFCLLNGHALLHNDRDFDHFEQFLGLQVIHP